MKTAIKCSRDLDGFGKEGQNLQKNRVLRVDCFDFYVKKLKK
jgi:hypothetical protein